MSDTTSEDFQKRSAGNPEIPEKMSRVRPIRATGRPGSLRVGRVGGPPHTIPVPVLHSFYPVLEKNVRSRQAAGATDRMPEMDMISFLVIHERVWLVPLPVGTSSGFPFFQIVQPWRFDNVELSGMRLPQKLIALPWGARHWWNDELLMWSTPMVKIPPPSTASQMENMELSTVVVPAEQIAPPDNNAEQLVNVELSMVVCPLA